MYVGRSCLVEAAAHGCSSQPQYLGEESLSNGSFLLYCKAPVSPGRWVSALQGNTHKLSSLYLTRGLCFQAQSLLPELLCPIHMSTPGKALCSPQSQHIRQPEKSVLGTWHSSDRRLVLQGLGIWEAAHFSLYRSML